VIAVGVGGVEQCIQAVGWDQYIEAGNMVRIEEPAMGGLRILSVDRFNKEDARDEKEQGNRMCTPIVMMSSIQKTARRMCVFRHFLSVSYCSFCFGQFRELFARGEVKNAR
jgi:hypothetical protein